METSSKKTITNSSVGFVVRVLKSTKGTSFFISIIATLACLTSPTKAQEESYWEDCANERQYCYFEGTKTVRFGAQGSYATGNYTGQVYCSSNTFGIDPAPGVVKTCSFDKTVSLSIDPINDYESTQTEDIFLIVNANYSTNDSVNFSASGLPNGVSINSSSGEISGILMNTGSFNVSVSATSSNGETATQTFVINVVPLGEWASCAGEQETCSFSGDAEVRFGTAPNAYIYKHFTDGAYCSNNIFGGDPAPGQVKTCSYRKEATPLIVGQIPNQTAYLNYETVIQVAVTSSAGDPIFSATGLPPGLDVNSSTGIISGTPAIEGEYDTTLFINDIAGNEERVYTSWAVLGEKPVGVAMNSSQLIYLDKASTYDEIWAVNPDNDTVSVFDADNDQKIAEIDVGQAPHSLVPFNNEIWVVNRDTSDISILSTQTYTEIDTIFLSEASQPYAIVVDSINEQFYVSLAATGEVLQINANSREIEASLHLGQNIRGLSIDETSSYLYVSRFITPKIPGEDTDAPDTSSAGAELFVVSLSDFSLSQTILLAHSDSIDGFASGSGIPNYLGSMAISPDGTQGWVPSKQDNIKLGSSRVNGMNLNHQNTVRAISSSIDLVNHEEVLEERHDYDNSSLASAAIYHPSGNYLFVALETSQEVAVVDLSSGTEIRRINTGGIAPQALALSPDSNTLFVQNFMERAVTKHDITSIFNQVSTSTLEATYSLVSNELLSNDVLLGKQLFYDAADSRLALESYMSCASCHNDGGHDGRIWDLTGFGEGLRNTISLEGKAGMAHGMLHWSANFDEVQDFEGQIRDLAGGTGLMSDDLFDEGTRNQPLGETKAGHSGNLDAIAAYLSSLSDFDNSPFRSSNVSLSSTAEIGKTLFADSGCIDCHSGTTFTDSNALTPLLHNIGTITTLSGNRLNGTLDGLDTPTLRDLWQTAPYLHDGSAATIEEAITAHNTVTLAPTDISAITQYLLELDDREIAAPEESEWVFCVGERKTCEFEGTRQVRYGAGNSFNYDTFTGEVFCSNANFGDPIPGTAKSCYYKNSTEIVPTLNNPGQQTSAIGTPVNLVISANDIDNLNVSYSAANLPDGVSINESGVISGNVSVAGTLTTSISLLIDGEIEDTVSFSWTVVDPSNPDESWIECASERGYCAFTGEADVRYGSDGAYNFGTYTDGVSCNNNTFGDPTPGVAKTCEYRLIFDNGIVLEQINDQTTELGNTISLQVDLSESGVGALTFSAANLPTGLNIDVTSGLISGTVSTLGTSQVTVTVIDSLSETDTASFNWLVTDEPIIEDNWIDCANEKQTCTFPGIKEVRFGANGSYAFGVYEGSVLCSNTTFGDPAPGQVKTCEYRSDGNVAPIITNPGSKLSAINLNVSFPIVANDPEGDAITFSASNLPAGINIDENTGLVSGVPSEVGISQVTITASDESGESSQINFAWEIRTEVGGNENWVLCASEGDTCILPSGEEFKIYFGANDQYSSRFDIGSVYCGSPFFDDPIEGVAKECYYEIVPEDEAWTKCADQNEFCSFSGIKLVRFGAQRAFDYRVATDGIDCSYDEFDEPIGGVLKRCEVKNIDSDEAFSDFPTDIDADSQWVFCAPNSLTCHFPGTKTVRYIIGDEFVEATHTDSVFCSEESFPLDPVVSAKQLEHCEVLLNRSEVGEWSAPIDWPMIAVHASLMPDGKLLTHNATNDDLNGGYAEVSLWDPSTNTFSLLDPLTTTFGEQSSEMFCAGFDLMPDGNLLITGSEPNLTTNNNLNATRFDFRGERFSRINDSEIYRYYPSVTTMPSGDMVNFAGTQAEAPLEVFRFDGSWDVLDDTEDTYLNNFSYYAWGQVAPNGQLFYPGPDTEMKFFDLRGEGTEIGLGARDTINRDYGSYALYDIGKMFITGGGKPATDSTMLIDINGLSPVVTQGSTMGMPRRHGNLTILADGSLLKTGGHTGDTHADFQPELAVFSAELWSPETQQWTTLSSMKINRLYHSTAILLPDGRVFSGGTGYPFTIPENESNAEIFSPPYLFNHDGTLAARPEITRSPKSLGYDHNFTVEVDSNLDIQKVHVIKLGTVTHHQNFGQRLVPLNFTQSGNTLELTSPEGPNIAPPGYYMLVVVDSDGRPSVAEMVQVQPYSTIHLKAQSNDMLLDIASGDTYADSFISAGAANSELSQLWSIHPSNDGYFKLISRSSGYALSAADDLLTLGSDADSIEEQWQFVSARDGYLALQSRSSSQYLALDIQNPGQLILNDSPSEAQGTLWQISPVGDVNIAGELSGQLLDAGDTDLDGAEVYVADHSGARSQAWYFESADNGYSYIRSRSGSKALSLDNGSIVQQVFNGSDSQLWSLNINEGGSFKIEARMNQTVISANDDNADIGQSSISDSAELWRLVPAVSGQPDNISDDGGQVLYRSLVQGFGQTLWKTNGQTSGNSELSSALEWLEISTNGVRDNMDIEYRVYEELSGWSEWAQNNEQAGQTTESISGLQVRLGDNAENCTLAYRVNTEATSWSIWQSHGRLAGSTNPENPILGIQITLVCNDSVDTVTTNTSAEVTVTSGNTDIDYSSFRDDAVVISNSSLNENIERVEINIESAFLMDLIYDPSDLIGDADPACLTEGTGGNDTGFLSPNDLCLDPYSVNKSGGYTTITLDFNDFEPGESFTFGTDIDPASIQNASNIAQAGSVSGMELSGAQVTVYFDSGNVFTTDLFPDGTQAGAKSCINNQIKNAPTITLAGGGGLPQNSSQSTLDLDLYGDANAMLKIFVVESSLLGQNGSNIDTYESNTAESITEYVVILDDIGYANLQVQLDKSSSSGGYNHIIAANEDDATGCTGRVSVSAPIYFNP